MADYDYLIRGKFPGLPLLESEEEVAEPKTEVKAGGRSSSSQGVIGATSEETESKTRRTRRPVS